MAFRNLAREYSTTTGTSDCVLTGAVPGCNTWELAGIANGETVRYGIITYSLTNNRPTHSEVGIGTYNTATNTLTRGTVESSTAAGAKITLTGLSEVYICPTALDFNSGGNPFASYYQNGSATAVTNNTDNALLDLDTERVDLNGISALAADTVTITGSGWYEVHGLVGVAAGAAFNGYIAAYTDKQADAPKKIYVTADAIQSDTIVLPPALFLVTTTGTVTVRLDNHSGQTVNGSVYELTITKKAGL